MILTALNEVLIAGARLGAACPVIGVSARTIQRWKRTRMGTTSGVDRDIAPAMRSARARKPGASPC